MKMLSCLRLSRRRLAFALVCVVLAAAIGIAAIRFAPTPISQRLNSTPIPDWITEEYIRFGGPSRRGTPLSEFNAVVVHYVGNPDTTAQQNRNYFDNPDSEVSAHFVVGLDGEVIQCLPLGEVSAASNHRNRDTVSIEVCHPDDSGQFTDATYQSLVRLTAWLLDIGGLPRNAVIRHYDVTGKECPRYFVRNPDAWDTFCADVAAYVEA